MQLRGQCFDQSLFGDELHVDQNLAELTAPPLLFAQRGAKFGFVEHPSLDQDLTQLLSRHRLFGLPESARRIRAAAIVARGSLSRQVLRGLFSGRPSASSLPRRGAAEAAVGDGGKARIAFYYSYLQLRSCTPTRPPRCLGRHAMVR